MTPVQVLVAVGLSSALTVGWLALLPHAARSGGDTVFYLCAFAVWHLPLPWRRPPAGPLPDPA